MAQHGFNMIDAECWTVAVKAGVAPEAIVDVFMNAALRSMMSLKVRRPATSLRGDFEARFALNLARTDLGLATELGRISNIPMRMATLCEQEMSEGISCGWGGQDSSIILTLQEERAQARLPASASGQA